MYRLSRSHAYTEIVFVATSDEGRTKNGQKMVILKIVRSMNGLLNLSKQHLKDDIKKKGRSIFTGFIVRI